MKLPRLKGALNFVEHEASGGLALIAATLVAMAVANSSLADSYHAFFETHAAVRVGPYALDQSLLHWVNDGLMAIFFFLVGLEIKRELLAGELSTVKKASLPVIAALGGMIVPSAIYATINWSDPVALRGWAIPAATDIAFAVAVLALLGPRVPASLKVFLLALAIIDDLGAILIIGVFYTSKLSLLALALAGAGGAVLLALNLSGVKRIAPYVLAGLFMWVCVLESGVHATLAGVVAALAIPLNGANGGEPGPLERLEDGLHHWVTFGVLPLFAFANAGVSLSGVTWGAFAETIPLGILLGLFIGKPLGIFCFTFASCRLGLGEKPEGSAWAQVFGVAMLGGVGFTMSLFIGMLAFPDPEYGAGIRLGVLAGSLLSAAAGYVFLRIVLRGDDVPAPPSRQSG